MNTIGTYGDPDYQNKQSTKDGCFAFFVEFVLLGVLIAAVVTCSGCSTHRKVDRSTDIVRFVADTAMVVNTSSHIYSVDRMEQWRKMLDGRQSMKVTIYDTSLPVDEATNRAPVIADMEISTIIKVDDVKSDSTSSVSVTDASEEAFNGHHDGEVYNSRNRESWDNEPDNGLLAFGAMIFLVFVVALCSSGMLERIIRKVIR